MKMKIAEAEESPPWDIHDLEAALSNLKNNKARDSEGYINEIFKSGVIGNDLKKSLLVMFNRMKKEKLISMFLNTTNITTVPKKGSKIELKNDTIGKQCMQSGYGYKYKDSLSISMLGLVDDIIGVTEAGFRAQQMNALINVNSADKGLQFGPTKCKSMLIGKETEHVLNTE